ncbi:unnamed protein product [[Actinomadura] parvosata subsp. kistnae]|nr:unnamed protein product [Actinomadura parvosata subsp. kistnae]
MEPGRGQTIIGRAGREHGHGGATGRPTAFGDGDERRSAKP